MVVPYKLPLLSIISPDCERSPGAALKEASVVIVPLPLASSKTVPPLCRASNRRCTVQIAAAVHDQAIWAWRSCCEGSQCGDRATAMGQFEYRVTPYSIKIAAASPRPEGRSARHRRQRLGQRSQRGDRAGAMGQFVNRAIARRSRARDKLCQTDFRCCPRLDWIEAIFR